ncbi:sulfur carrier protein ThiS [Staphylococcus saccharolyticus]|uniref:sulfur carrier protein ThiS n=1 Tax=Staphylococcus saccharolyticus TaxID=33028 RepID=UPI00102DD3D9|nr:sulfur carrier protein ThiS [Staphylococcus saccharolyticus]TAA92212.1 thiamine biosynthesis protein ThiS [Staphylococcus saccharolyticus]TAA92642.1 thiamine biosynthesis protein ThiS [Staphylococcus saccharolyticus]
MPIEKGIDGLLFRTSMNYDELKDKIIQLIQHGFEKDKIIIHSDITLLEELNLSRIHFKNNDTTAFSYKVSHPNIIVGMSTHDVATVNLCRKKGLDYVFFGHLFPTMSHPDTPPRTTKEIQDVLLSLDLVPKRVIVEMNKEFIKQDNYTEHTVREDDRLELLEIVGGG